MQIAEHVSSRAATFRCNAMTCRFGGKAHSRVWFARRIYEFTALIRRTKGPKTLITGAVEFRPLHDHLLAMGTVATVYFWDDMHDRYLISDIVGVQMPNGFDTTTAPNSITTWSRLSRNARDDIQREFDPATGRHKLHYTFIVGK